MDVAGEVTRIEGELIAAGVPACHVMRVAAVYANALVLIDKAKRDAAALRARNAATALRCREVGTTQAATEAGIAPRTARWRRGRWLKVGNATP